METARGDPSTGRVSLEDLKAGSEESAGSGYEAGQSPDLAAIAYAEVVAGEHRPALLRVGSSGTVTVWLEGSTAFHAEHAAGRPYAPDSDTVPITLRKGTNRFVVQSREGIGPWSFSLELSEPSATP